MTERIIETAQVFFFSYADIARRQVADFVVRLAEFTPSCQAVVDRIYRHIEEIALKRDHGTFNLVRDQIYPSDDRIYGHLKMAFGQRSLDNVDLFIVGKRLCYLF